MIYFCMIIFLTLFLIEVRSDSLIGDINYTLNFTNMSSSSIDIDTVTNNTFSINITNWDNETRIYNLSLGIEGSALNYTMNYSGVTVNDLNFSENESFIINITFWSNTSGLRNVSVFGILADNNSVILNSTNDFGYIFVNITSETQAPLIVLNSPSEDYSTSSTSVTFNYTATDNSGVFDHCNLTIDDSVNITVLGVTSGSPTVNTTTGFSVGSHNWTVTCLDGYGNVNSSILLNFSVTTASVTPTIVGGGGSSSSSGETVTKYFMMNDLSYLFEFSDSIKSIFMVPLLNTVTGQMTLNKVDTFPSLLGDIYEVYSISTNINFNTMKIEFKISKSWFEQRTVNDVALSYYHNGWRENNAYFIRSDANYYYFVSDIDTVPSYIAIVKATKKTDANQEIKGYSGSLMTVGERERNIYLISFGGFTEKTSGIFVKTTYEVRDGVKYIVCRHVSI